MPYLTEVKTIRYGEIYINYLKNKFKDRLTYCREWKNSVDIYLANKEISEKTNREYYKSKPLLKLILNLYFMPYNALRFFSNHNFIKSSIVKF